MAATLRYLGASEAGALYAGISALALSAALSELGLSSSAVRDYVNASAADRPVFLGQLIRLRLALLLPACTAAVALSWLIQNDEITLGLALGTGWYVLLVLYSAATVPWTADLRSGSLAVAQVVQALSALGCTTALVLLEAPTWLFFGVQTPGLLLCLSALYLSTPASRPRLRRQQTKVLRFDRTALVLGLASIVGILYYRSGALAVQLLAGAEAAGEYGAAFRMLDVAESVAPLLLAVVLPVLAQGAQDDAFQRRFDELLRVMTVLGVVATAAAVVLAPAAVRLVAGDGFPGAARALQVMSAGLLAAFVGQTFGFALLSRKQHRTMLLGTSGALLTTAALLLALVPRHEALGAAAALLVGQVVLTAVYVQGYRRSAPSGVPLRVLFQGALVALSAAGAALVVPGPLAVAALTCALVLIVMVPATGLLTPSAARALLLR